MNSTILTMKLGKGLGLAANQVGITKRFFAIDMSYFDVVKEPIVIINPEIAELSGNALGEEGCLSFPGLFFEVDRAEKAVITGLDINGKEVTFETQGLIARVMLHEIDHLNGRLFIDHLSKLKRSLIAGKLKKIKAGEKV
jgi:peptide deformylase